MLVKCRPIKIHDDDGGDDIDGDGDDGDEDITILMIMT